MGSKAATSRLPKMSANLMNCIITALGKSRVGGDWAASTEGSTSVRTIRARRYMRPPKNAPAVSMTTTLVSAPKQHIMKVSDVQELIDSLLLVRGTAVVGCRDLVAHPVAQICWSVGTPVPVVEPFAKLSPIHRRSKLRPELFLVALAKCVDCVSRPCAAHASDSKEIGDSFDERLLQERLASRIMLLIMDELVHNDAGDDVRGQVHDPQRPGEFV